MLFTPNLFGANAGKLKLMDYLLISLADFIKDNSYFPYLLLPDCLYMKRTIVREYDLVRSPWIIKTLDGTPNGSTQPLLDGFLWQFLSLLS